MNDQDFLTIVNHAIGPFLKELGFWLETPSISGRFYRVSFSSQNHAVWISFEPGEDAFFVTVFCRENGRLSDIDDPVKTLRLAELNSRYMNRVKPEERAATEKALQSLVPKDEEERVLLKLAKELRVVLPKYLTDQVRS
jgi:hypothetical protein